MALVESATRTWLCVQSLDAWLLGQTSLVNARRKGVHPVVRERLLLVESLQRTLLALGLDRAPKPAKTLEAIAAEIASRRDEQERPQTDEGHMEASEGAMSAPGAVSHDQGAESESPEEARDEPRRGQGQAGLRPGLEQGAEGVPAQQGNQAVRPGPGGLLDHRGDQDRGGEGQAGERPGGVTDVVVEASSRAAARILGTWGVVEQGDPVGQF